MPIYVFKCECGSEFEVIAKVGDDIAACSCGKMATRIFSGESSFRLGDGGCGWARDGYNGALTDAIMTSRKV